MYWIISELCRSSKQHSSLPFYYFYPAIAQISDQKQMVRDMVMHEAWMSPCLSTSFQEKNCFNLYSCQKMSLNTQETVGKWNVAMVVLNSAGRGWKSWNKLSVIQIPCALARFSVQRIYSGFKVIESGIFFTETSDYFSDILWSSYRPCSQIWHLCVTNVEWFVSSYLWVTWRVPHVGQEMLTLSGTPDWFHSLWEFMISRIHYIYIIYYWICQF